MPDSKHACVFKVNHKNTHVFKEHATIVFMNTYGDRVRARRIELGLSQAELAKLIGAKNQSTIGNIENRPGASRYTMKLSHALKVRYEWLETGLGPKELPEEEAPILLNAATLPEILQEIERRGASDSAKLLAELILKNHQNS